MRGLASTPATRSWCWRGRVREVRNHAGRGAGLHHPGERRHRLAVRCELWPGCHLFNGVFLNRSILHLLDEPELASVIGHELGHVFPHAPLLSRCYLLRDFRRAGVVFARVAVRIGGVALVAPLADSLAARLADRLSPHPAFPGD